MSPDDNRYLLAAQGWLELGDWKSAHEELENIQPQMRAHPDVLKMRVEVYSAGKKWDYVLEVARALARLLPDHAFGHIRLAYALHELKCTKEAWNALLPVAHKFPTEWVIPYNLACYATQLVDLIGARNWLAQSFKLGDAKEIKLQALEDPDLAPLWTEGDQARFPLPLLARFCLNQRDASRPALCSHYSALLNRRNLSSKRVTTTR